MRALPAAFSLCSLVVCSCRLRFSYKLVSIGLCSNINGQIMTDLMVAPPKAGDASYPLYHQEVTGIFSSLKRRAAKVPHLALRMLCSFLLRAQSHVSLPLPSTP